MRILYSATIPCKAGCKYCFAKWHDIYHGQPKPSEELINKYNDEREIIIYPCCDGEFFDQSNLFNMVDKYAASMEKVYVSISTKQQVQDEDLFRLAQLNSKLVSSAKGFVKFSISLSTKSRLAEIEPGTMTYSERIDLAKRISEAEIPHSLTLKPILPFIAKEEYFEIINDFSRYLQHVLIGGLYINKNTEFYRDYLSGKWDISTRRVKWLTDNPEWEYIIEEEKLSAIHNYCQHNDIAVFDSDIDLIKSYIK